MIDLKNVSEQLKGFIDLLEFFKNSSMERFDFTIAEKFDIIIYKVKNIVRIDIKYISK